jgi:Holliday junction DNA helicase RuvA
MIDTVEGKLVTKTPARITVNFGGIGFAIHIPLSTFSTLPDVGEEVKLYTYLYVREDILKLYGFASTGERQLFNVLMNVNRIGPSLALQVLSSCSVEKFKDLVARGDVRALSSMVKGVGKKTAQRMILELKGELADMEAEDALSAEGTSATDALKALIEIGVDWSYARDAVQAAVKKLGPDATPDALVNEALTRKK